MRHLSFSPAPASWRKRDCDIRFAYVVFLLSQRHEDTKHNNLFRFQVSPYDCSGVIPGLLRAQSAELVDLLPLRHAGGRHA